jgi:hypothetical protein
MADLDEIYFMKPLIVNFKPSLIPSVVDPHRGAKPVLAAAAPADKAVEVRRIANWVSPVVCFTNATSAPATDGRASRVENPPPGK